MLYCMMICLEDSILSLIDRVLVGMRLGLQVITHIIIIIIIIISNDISATQIKQH